MREGACLSGNALSEPLNAKRPCPAPSRWRCCCPPRAGAGSLARLDVETSAAAADRLADAALERLRRSIPAPAACLAGGAGARAGRCVLDTWRRCNWP